jgi:hypothetical protein
LREVKLDQRTGELVLATADLEPVRLQQLARGSTLTQSLPLERE